MYSNNMIYVLINRNKRLLINHNLSWDLNQCTTCTRRNVRKEEGRLVKVKRQGGAGALALMGRGAIFPYILAGVEAKPSPSKSLDLLLFP